MLSVQQCVDATFAQLLWHSFVQLPRNQARDTVFHASFTLFGQRARSTIERFCLDIKFHGMATDFMRMPVQGIQDPDLIFWDAEGTFAEQHVDSDSFPTKAINVLLLDKPLSSNLISSRSTWVTVNTCLYKPLQVPDLLIALSNGRSLLELRRALEDQKALLGKILERQSNPGMVGIPTRTDRRRLRRSGNRLRQFVKSHRRRGWRCR